jgi:YesN/AraC family two-component response regulator
VDQIEGLNFMDVLIVEDEMIIALMIEQMVKRMGHTVVGKTAKGEKAIEQAHETKPDLILMDIRLQGEMDGVDAISKIQHELDIQVIYITGNTDQKYKNKVESTNYIDFLIKPITQHQLSDSFDLAS